MFVVFKAYSHQTELCKQIASEMCGNSSTRMPNRWCGWAFGPHCFRQQSGQNESAYRPCCPCCHRRRRGSPTPENGSAAAWTLISGLVVFLVTCVSLCCVCPLICGPRSNPIVNFGAKNLVHMSYENTTQNGGGRGW